MLDKTHLTWISYNINITQFNQKSFKAFLTYNIDLNPILFVLTYNIYKVELSRIISHRVCNTPKNLGWR